jgi:hypothetical protein
VNVAYQQAEEAQYVTVGGRKWLVCQRTPKNLFKCGPKHGNLYCNLRGDYCSVGGFCGPGTQYKSRENMRFKAGQCHCPFYSRDGACGKRITCANPGEVCTRYGKCMKATPRQRRRLQSAGNPNKKYAFKPCIAKP